MNFTKEHVYYTFIRLFIDVGTLTGRTTTFVNADNLKTAKYRTINQLIHQSINKWVDFMVIPLSPNEIKGKYITLTLFPQCHGFHRFLAILAVFISIGPYGWRKCREREHKT